MAHAEASARTVEAAVTAAAAQLGLRSDQVDIEVLEDPVPSTFGFIGSPARVRVTPRTSSNAPTNSGSAGPEAGSVRFCDSEPSPGSTDLVRPKAPKSPIQPSPVTPDQVARELDRLLPQHQSVDHATAPLK